MDSIRTPELETKPLDRQSFTLIRRSTNSSLRIQWFEENDSVTEYDEYEIRYSRVGCVPGEDEGQWEGCITHCSYHSSQPFATSKIELEYEQFYNVYSPFNKSCN